MQRALLLLQLAQDILLNLVLLMLTNCVCCCIKFVILYWVHSETCKPKFLASGYMQYQNDYMQHTFSNFGENCVINCCNIFLYY